MLNYKSKIGALPKNLGLMLALVAFIYFSGWLPTQWFAAKFAYDERLGSTILRTPFLAIYWPHRWMLWWYYLPDIPALHQALSVMFFLAIGGAVGALLSTIGLAQFAWSSVDGMKGLHGSAHFAEFDELDKTGFVEARGRVVKGVVVGAVMLDKKGAIIHPHHPSFDQRYLVDYAKPPIIKWKTDWKKPLQFSVQVWKNYSPYSHKEPKRDDYGRVKYRINYEIVKGFKILMDDTNTHLFAFCPTRSGKGVALVIPTLLTWEFSVMVNDIKGEAYALTAGYRKKQGHRVIKFEPACQNDSTARWNPLDEIRIGTGFDVADCQMIMSMACDPEGKGLEDYWAKAGYELLTGVALHCRYMGGRDGIVGSLAGVAQFLADDRFSDTKDMFASMKNAEHDVNGEYGWKDKLGAPSRRHPMIVNTAVTMLNKEEKDCSGVLSTAKALLSLFLDPNVAKNTNSSDFLVRDLMKDERRKEGDPKPPPVSLYYIVSPSDLERMTSLTRLFYALFIRRNASEMHFSGGTSVAGYDHKLLMLIDEMPALKKLPILAEAQGYVAGYGIRMFLLAQDVAQVEDLYGENQTIVSGAETRIAYAPNNIKTAELLARMTGKTTVTEENSNHSRNLTGIHAGSASISTQKTARDLVTADEFMALDNNDLVLFVKGISPIYGAKPLYYEHPVLLARAKVPPPAESDRLRKRKEEVTPSEPSGEPSTTVPQKITPSSKFGFETEANTTRVMSDAEKARALEIVEEFRNEEPFYDIEAFA